MDTVNKTKILTGHTSFETAYKIENYPWGYKLRTTMYVWIESKKNKGDREVRQTIDPRTGRLCAPKASTYAPFMYLYLDEQNHVQHGQINAYEREKFADRINFLVNEIEVANDIQVENLRAEYYGHTKASYRWILVKYNDERKPLFTEWMKGKLKHILTSEITEWCNYPAPPEQDQPNEEVKFTSTVLTNNY